RSRIYPADREHEDQGILKINQRRPAQKVPVQQEANRQPAGVSFLKARSQNHLVQKCSGDEGAGHVQKHRRRIEGPEEVCSQEVVPVVESMLTASQLEKPGSSVGGKEDKKRAVAAVQEIGSDLVIAHVVQPHP